MVFCCCEIHASDVFMCYMFEFLGSTASQILRHWQAGSFMCQMLEFSGQGLQSASRIGDLGGPDPACGLYFGDL